MVITHIESPNEFFVRMESDETKFLEISQLLNEALTTLETLKAEECNPGQFCIVNYKGKNYRARVDSEKECRKKILAYLIDQGMSIWIARTNAYSVNQALFQHGIHLKPGLAFQCRLQGIRPSTRTGCIWCGEALDLFTSYCRQHDDHVKLEIYSVVESVIASNIKYSDDPKSAGIIQLLLEKKYAESCEESKASRVCKFIHLNRFFQFEELSLIKGPLITVGHIRSASN